MMTKLKYFLSQEIKNKLNDQIANVDREKLQERLIPNSSWEMLQYFITIIKW